jgi:sacsin
VIYSGVAYQTNRESGAALLTNMTTCGYACYMPTLNAASFVGAFSLMLIFCCSQRVTLVGTIQGILAKYPEGNNILKEFFQNADDAGASVLRVCLDKRTHPTARLPSRNLAPFQGPSLLIFNDAVFCEKDFAGICQVQESVKADDVSQTGRHGQGFNVVYHYTDLPTIVSGDKILTFDPHQE